MKYAHQLGSKKESIIRRNAETEDTVTQLQTELRDSFTAHDVDTTDPTWEAHTGALFKQLKQAHSDLAEIRSEMNKCMLHFQVANDVFMSVLEGKSLVRCRGNLADIDVEQFNNLNIDIGLSDWDCDWDPRDWIRARWTN